MSRRSNIVVFITLVVVAALHVSLAQTTHVVGDALGWTVPPGGDIAYRTWAASQTFVTGDVLLFNFTSGNHDVAEVTKESYDSCNATSPISMSTDGPTNITLMSAGEHYFICTFTRHCDLGQKLVITVSASSSGAPAPQPATPPPAASPETTPPVVSPPAPSPARDAMTYTVGDSLGWTVPPGGPVAYQAWARGKSFMVGDSLVFNFANGSHDVVKVSKSEYDSCNTSATTTTPITASPATITLATSGEHYFICTFSQHCSFGQKLAINVTGSGGGGTTIPPPSGSPSTPTPPGVITSPPPSSNSATSFGVTALPFTILAVAVLLI